MKFPDLLSKLKLQKGYEKNKSVFIAAACLLVLYLDFSLITSLQLKVIKNTSEKAMKVSNNLSSFAKDTAAIEELKRNSFANRKTEGALRAKKAILEEELPLLLQGISDTANKNNVKIMQMKPYKDPKQKEETVSGKKFLPFMITLNLSCGYHSLGSFINQLEDSPSFLAVEEIRIRQGSGDYLLQDVNLGLKTYIKK